MNRLKASVALLFALIANIFPQTNITGHVQSVPDLTNAFARIWFTNTTTLDSFYIFTDSLTGNFSTSITPATYIIKVEVYNHFLYKDTLALLIDTNLYLQAIKDIGCTTTYYQTILEVLETITKTKDPPYSMNTILERWQNEDQPIKVFRRNYDPSDPYSMPQDFVPFFESTQNDISTKSNGKVLFSEQSSPVDVGINFIYVPSNEMPIPGTLGYTLIEEYYPDNSPKKVKIYINREISASSTDGVFCREFMRTMITTNAANDPNYIMAWQSIAEVLHQDEGNALQIMYTLKNSTDMKNHLYEVVNYPLPVELTSFDAILLNDKVLLNWNTATELNNYGFEIQRKQVFSSQSSVSNKDWQSVGFVFGNGTSNSPKNYSFTDEDLTSGKYSYRLKQIDNDGTFEYSNVIEISIGLPNKFILEQNFPNPFNPSTRISWQSPVAAQQTLKVYDVLGNEVATLVNEFRNAGVYEIDFDGSKLSSGVYFYQLKAGDPSTSSGQGFIQTKKMILMK